MAMPILLSPLTQVPLAAPSTLARLVVVGEKPLNLDERSKLDGEAPTASTQRLATLGYTAVEKDGSAFYFSPALWGGDRLAELKRVWSDAARAVQPDGTVQISGAPELRKFLDDRLAELGYEGAAGGTLLATASTTVTFTMGGESRQIPFGGAPGRSGQALKNHPIKAVDPQKRRPATEFGPFAHFVVADSLCAYSPGRRALDAIQRMKDVSEAGAILAEHYEKEAQALKSLRASFAEKSPLLADSGIKNGARFDQLPSSVQHQIERSFVSAFKSEGFADENEARNWMMNAHVSSTSSSYRIFAGAPSSAGGPSYIGVQLP